MIDITIAQVINGAIYAGVIMTVFPSSNATYRAAAWSFLWCLLTPKMPVYIDIVVMAVLWEVSEVLYSNIMKMFDPTYKLK